MDLQNALMLARKRRHCIIHVQTWSKMIALQQQPGKMVNFALVYLIKTGICIEPNSEVLVVGILQPALYEYMTYLSNQTYNHTHYFSYGRIRHLLVTDSYQTRLLTAKPAEKYYNLHSAMTTAYFHVKMIFDGMTTTKAMFPKVNHVFRMLKLNSLSNVWLKSFLVRNRLPQVTLRLYFLNSLICSSI